MAVTRSGLFINQWIAFFTGVHVFDFSLETHRMALFDNTITPDFSASAVNACYGAGAFASGEIVGSGYTAGGALVTGTTVVESSASRLAFRADPVEWPTSAIVAARCGLLYAPYISTPNANPAIALFDFGDDESSAGGLFVMTLPTDNLVWDQVPA